VILSTEKPESEEGKAEKEEEDWDEDEGEEDVHTALLFIEIISRHSRGVS